MNPMSYLEFYAQWHPFGCFNIQQVYAWRPNFNRHNLRNWEKKGYIAKLKKEFYAFTDCKTVPDFSRYIANRLYMPSYISLHSALSFYGMIPEAVIQYTSVTTLKTNKFQNLFGDFSYQTIKPALFFGYEPKPMADGRSILFATPEKAILDLLYLYPFYKTEQDMLELRLDEDFMEDDFNLERFNEYLKIANSPELASRAQTLLKAYSL